MECLCAIVQIPPDQPENVVDAVSMPMMLGGVGLRSAVRVSVPAYWASWVDALPVIRQRHLEIVERLVTEFEIGPHTPFLRAAVDAQRRLTATVGFEPSSWQAAALGARPLPRGLDDFEPGSGGATVPTELFSRVPDQVQALFRSQGGPGRRCSPHRSSRVQFPHISARWCQSLPSLSAVADVAVSSTFLAIIEQFVPEWGCWVVEDFQCKALRRGYAGRQEDA